MAARPAYAPLLSVHYLDSFTKLQDPDRVHHDCPTGGIAGLVGRLWPSLLHLSIINCDHIIFRGTDFVAVGTQLYAHLYSSCVLAILR